MIKSIKSIVIFLLLSTQLTAQSKYSLSGTISDAQNGEALLGAAVTVVELKGTGVVTNDYGFYSLTLPQGDYTVKVSYVGYEDNILRIKLDKSQKLDIKLSSGAQLQEVVIKATREDDNVTKAQMGAEHLEIKEIDKVPVIFGEKDILKTIQLLPGVKSAGEGNSGFNVRGGASDQNLILLDEAPVYNASHLLGFFSTFNSDAIKDATIIKGNAPAQYGGRLSSVLDIKMKEGNDKTYNVNGGVGLISSRLSVEGPIQKEKSSFLISGRRTYADVFLKLSEQFKDNKLFFYDLNAKMNYRLNDKNRVYLSGYFGRDVLGIGKDIGIDWGNKTGTLRWNSLISPKWFSNTSLIYSDFGYNVKFTQNKKTYNINSAIRDVNLKQEFQYYPNTKNAWRIGLNVIHHTLTPSRFKGEGIPIDTKTETRFGLENALYVNNTWNVAPKLNVDYGLRTSLYSVLGKGTFRFYDRGELYDYTTLKNNELGKSYLNFEPRLSASLRVDEKMSLKAAYARNTQHLHLLSNSGTGEPTSDIWVANSYSIKPEIADQASVGVFRNFADNKYEFSVEGYYKNMQNQVDFKDGADINTAADVETELLFGKGRAYGVELLMRKRTGKFTGWVSYTWSKTEKQITGINQGNWYVARQDRTHDVSVVGIYQLTKKWSMSGAWIYYTGNAVTFPSGKYNVNGNNILYYTERNGYRMPAYHRLDVSATYESDRKGRYQSSWNFGVYNAYGRKNAYQIQFEDDPLDKTRTRAVQTTLFQWVPSVTYNFKF
jgi:hypothetical protein